MKDQDQPMAVMISYNWETGEVLTQPFVGESAANNAEGWTHEKSFIWRDFPAEDGWTHFCHLNETAITIRAKQRVEAITREGPPIVLNIPQ